MFANIIFVLFSVVQIGLSIRCYDCNSANNSMCLEPDMYDEESRRHFLPAVDCRHGIIPAPSQDFFCRKIRQTILRKHYEPEVRVTRGCGWKRHSRACYKADNEDHLETVCQCDSDLCNRSPETRAAFTLLLGLLCFKMVV